MAHYVAGSHARLTRLILMRLQSRKTISLEMENQSDPLSILNMVYCSEKWHAFGAEAFNLP